MSGFEIAGVVLGALPLVIKALSAYQAGQGVLASMRKSRGLLEELIHRLKTQQMHFYLDMLDLLREARVPEILAEGDPPAARVVEILQESQAGDEIEQYLGPQLFVDFLEILGFYEEYLKQIISKLRHIARPPNAAKDDLDAVVRANRSPDISMPVKGRLKFAMDRESLQTLLKDLETERYSLGTLLRRVKTKREWEASEPTSYGVNLTLAFSRVQERAASLYRAAYQCWTCDRHEQHTLLIRLEHRISDRHDLSKRTSPVVFRLCFPMDEAMLQRIEVSVRCSIATTLASARGVKFQNYAARKSLAIPTINVTEAPKEAHPGVSKARIRSFCENVHEARSRSSVLCLELVSGASLEVALNDDTSSHSYARSISLAEYLRNTAGDVDARMTPIEQTLLALNIASSVLQLRPTRWCSTPWDSGTIQLPVQALDHSTTAILTPYVEQAIYPLPSSLTEQESSYPHLTTAATKTTMLELAILLLEILHHRSLETWTTKSNEDNPTTYWERMAVASRWLELSSSKLLPAHVKAVEECLVLCARNKLVWDDAFQRLYCENIIKPLQELVL